MHDYLHGLTSRLREAGFGGRVLMVTSQGGVMGAEATAEAPIHAINSGRAMAPVAGRFFAARDTGTDAAIVADTGGTSYGVSLVRQGRIPRTRETWLGEPFRGHMTGFPSVDVRSIGAGGGSIAWIDRGGLLRVGPRSAGSTPGPVCYGAGGTEPTVTDCALLLGYIDPDFFLGGAMRLDPEAATGRRGRAGPSGSCTTCGSATSPSSARGRSTASSSDRAGGSIPTRRRRGSGLRRRRGVPWLRRSATRS